MASYAAGTEVSVIRSIGEMEKLVTKYGATGFGYGRAESTGRVMFRIADRTVRFDVSVPDWHAFVLTPSGKQRRSQSEAERFAAAEERRLWRSLTALVKALLVGVADGVITLSDAFLPYTMLPDGETIAEFYTPQMDYVAATGEMPSPLPGAVATPAAIEAPRD